MSTLTKHTPNFLRSLSGPASRVASALKADKSASQVLAIWLEGEQRKLEPSLRKAIDLIAAVLYTETGKRQEEKMLRLSEFLIEDIELPKTAMIEAKMRADAIRHLITKGKWLNAADIAKQGGYSSSNSAEPANRWKREGKIFAVNFKGQDVFAAYQFDQGMKPRTVIAEVLKLFKNKTGPWKVAAWFAGVNGWLRGKRPQDCLDEPERLIEAARQEVAGFDG